MNYSLTIFKSIYDNKTHRKMENLTWEEFEALLYSLSKKPGYKPKKEERFHPNASPLISPAVFNPGDLRRNANVVEWGGWAALDVDEYSSSFDTALETFKDYKFICYSSASSTKEHPKFRVVLPLTRAVNREEIRHFWFSLSKEFNSLGDEQTKDFSRMYYVPAQYPNAFNFIVSNNASPSLNVDDLLNKYGYARELTPKTFLSNLPDDVKEKIASYRKAQLHNTNFRWSGLADCPFVNQKLVANYRTLNEGRYRPMYSFMLSVASSAMKKGYPITSAEIVALARELDWNGRWKGRPLEAEADRAIAYACTNV